MEQYCMLIITGKFFSSKKDIEVDFGEQHDTLFSANNAIVQQTLKVTEYYTIIDGLNYMTSVGWQIVHLMPFKTDSHGQTLDTLQYLMKRVI